LNVVSRKLMLNLSLWGAPCAYVVTEWYRGKLNRMLPWGFDVPVNTTLL